MTVRRAELERSLARVRQSTADPRGGLYGPGSLSWEINRESILFLGGGCAALLQLAHPFVAYAIDHHSATRRDPVGRFVRTFAHVYAMCFGDLDSALRSARRVHAVHTRVTGILGDDAGPYRGQRYHANDPDALLWVHATLVHTSLQVYERVVRPLSASERERYYAESTRFARLFGIPDRMLPGSWRELQRYWMRMTGSDRLTVTEPAAAIAGFLMRPSHRGLAGPSGWYRAVTAALLPPRLRGPFGLTFGASERHLAAASLRALRAGYARLPGRVRWVPAYIEARRRLAGDPGPDRLGRAVERLVVRALEA